MLESNQKRRFSWNNTKYYRSKIPAIFGVWGKCIDHLDLSWSTDWVLVACFPCFEEDDDVILKPAKEQYLVIFFERTF